jgi:hypothetical protein
MTRKIFILALGATMLFAAPRKSTVNKLSPSATTSVKLGGSTITVDYNAPSARGRKVEGGLVPYDSIWRAGADSATTLTTTGDLMIGDVHVPKGEYTLYVQGGEKGWELAINKQTGQWGTEYDKSQDLGRTAMKLTKLSTPAETLKIDLSAAGKTGLLSMSWGSTKATVDIMAH